MLFTILLLPILHFQLALEISQIPLVTSSTLPPNFKTFVRLFFNFSRSLSHPLTRSNPLTRLSPGSPLSYPASSALSLALHERACHPSLDPSPRCNSRSDHVLPTRLSTSTGEVTHSVSGTSTCREQPRRGCRFPGSDSALERFSAACRLRSGCVSRFYERAVPYLHAGGHGHAKARDPPAVRTFCTDFRLTGCLTR